MAFKKEGAMSRELEEAFHQKMVEVYDRARKECRYTDISMEALVLRDAWRGLFSEDELTVARKRLQDLGYTDV